MGRSLNSTLFNNRFAGLLLVFLLSITLLAIFYGKLLLSLNTTFFSTDGDGIQSYYNAYYLAKYDTSLMFSRSMNYPYGEVSFYTLSQPLVAGTIKFFSENFTDITPYTVGIINFLMLFSVILGAVFLYLLLAETGLPTWFATMTAVGIAFLSPQIDRFPGHYTLSYVFAIPLLLYLILLFHKRPGKILISAVTGIVLFVLMTCHVYFVAFYGIVIAFYWLFILPGRKNNQSLPPLKIILYIALQLIIPVSVFYLITSHYSHLTPDRPSSPYGFLVYRASPESVLLPLGVDYGRIFHKIRNFNYVQWEGIAYVGITASIGFFIILYDLINKIFRGMWKKILEVTDNHFLNILFWASLAALLYSFGIPFIFGLDFLVEYLGPLQQLRAIGRFSWLFYFVINLVVFYRIWRFQQTGSSKYRRVVILIMCIIFLYTDVYYFLKYRQSHLNNKFSAWSDPGNKDPDNKWLSHIEPGRYQAILPLPFYHMGSDNYGINAHCNMLSNSFLVSMKTGLPIAAIYMSRASISQSVRNIAMVLEPYRDLRIRKDFPVNKPFLIVVARCNEFTPEENNLISLGTKIDSNSFFNLYSLAFDSLMKIPQRKSEEIKNEFEKFPAFDEDGIYKDEPSAAVEYVAFDKTGTVEGYQGNGIKITGRSGSLLFDSLIHHGRDTVYLVSFWLNPIDRDLFPKTRLEINLYDEQGVNYVYKNEMAGAFLKTVDGSWGLIEYRINLSGSGSRVKIALYNDRIDKKSTYRIDELLLRPESCDFYLKRQDYFVKNNRWYDVR